MHICLLLVPCDQLLCPTEWGKLPLSDFQYHAQPHELEDSGHSEVYDHRWQPHHSPVVNSAFSSWAAVFQLTHKACRPSMLSGHTRLL